MALLSELSGGPRLKQLPISKITVNPHQPRRIFEPKGLAELAQSISRYGVITPLTVRREGKEYQLIAGERRLRASRMAGLEYVPCYIIQASEEESSAMALVENLHRKDLDPFEEGEGLLRLTKEHGLTQQQVASLMGLTQASVANKVRLLKLAPDTIALARQGGLSERHCRALLSIDDPERQLAAASHIIQKGLTVAASEEYIKNLTEKPPKPVKQVYIKDIRFFLNSVNKAVKSINLAGIPADCTRTTKEGKIYLTITIPEQVE